jgi:hypothetical protein
LHIEVEWSACYDFEASLQRLKIVRKESKLGSLFRIMMDLPLFRSVLRPISRVLVGLIAIPIFRFVMRRVFRLQDLDDELEKDLEEWFRGALLLLAATANMEHLLFGWMQKVDWLDRADWLTMGLRLMLAISVIEAMPDQELFAVLHPGPPKLEKGKNPVIQLWKLKWKFLKGFVCRHLNRSSPVLAMMCAIIGSQMPVLNSDQKEILRRDTIASWAYCQQCAVVCPMQSMVTLDALQQMVPELKRESDLLARHRERWLVGWVCYLMAITQYLIIGLVTSRDRALDVLSEFDRAVARRRNELIEEFKLEGNLPKDFDPNKPLPKPQDSTAKQNTP